MSTHTDGQLCFGVLCEEDAEFAWDEYEDIDEWWTFDILGFNYSFELFDSKGDWLGGKEAPKSEVDRYFGEKREFEKGHTKLPIVLVNYCSLEVPMYLIALPESLRHAARGYPEKIELSGLVVEPTRIAELVRFCVQYNIPYEGVPQWYLSSYWG